MRLSSVTRTSRLLAVAGAPKSALAALRYQLGGLTHKKPRALPRAALPVLEGAREDAFRDLSFTFAVIALCARVAMQDGRVSRQEYLAFRAAFPLKDGLCGKLRQLFMSACADTTPCEHYIARIRHSFPGEEGLYATLVARLFRIAGADGITRDKERLLAQMARAFGLSGQAFSALHERQVQQEKATDILGVPAHIPARALQKRYHEKMRELHPDRFAAQALSPEVQALLTLQAQEVNAAYRALRRRVIS